MVEEEFLPNLKMLDTVFSIWVFILAMTLAFLLIGVLGFRYIAEFSWIDSLHNAALYISGLGPADAVTGDAAKIFASIYALVAGIFFLALTAYLIGKWADMSLSQETSAQG